MCRMIALTESSLANFSSCSSVLSADRIMTPFRSTTAILAGTESIKTCGSATRGSLHVPGCCPQQHNEQQKQPPNQAEPKPQ